MFMQKWRPWTANSQPALHVLQEGSKDFIIKQIEKVQE